MSLYHVCAATPTLTGTEAGGALPLTITPPFGTASPPEDNPTSEYPESGRIATALAYPYVLNVANIRHTQNETQMLRPEGRLRSQEVFLTDMHTSTSIFTTNH